MFTFKLPELGEGLSEGEIVGWKVKEGETIKADQPLVEVMTDKATIEVPSTRAGVVKKLYYKVGDVAKVHGPLVDIEESGAVAAVPDRAAASEKLEATSGRPVTSASAQVTRAPTPLAAPATTGTEKVLASPAVRKMAREMGVDLAVLPGSGDRGRVLRDDLQNAGATGARVSAMPSRGGPQRSEAQYSEEERIPFIGIRRKIAEALSKSMYTAVHFTHNDEADFTEVMKLREEANAWSEKKGDGTRVSYLPFYIKAAVAGLKKFPILNSTLDEKTNEVVIKHYYHFGISIQTDAGLMVGVVRDCDRKDIFQIARDIKDVADRARKGKASVQDLTGSTITITNPGNIGGLHSTPVINFPEVCILGMYQIKKRPVVREVNGEDQIVARPMMYLNITCDHRIVDGAVAAEFMRLVCDYIENPARMAFF